MKNILLLNPGAPDIMVRGLIRERPSQFGFCWPSIDLLLISGYLHKKGYLLTYIDASINNLSIKSLAQTIRQKNIEVIISLYSHFTKDNDINFLKRIKEAIPQIKIIILADFEFVIFPKSALKFLDAQDWLDAVVFNPFFSDLDDYLKCNHSYDLVNIYFKNNGIIGGGKISEADENNCNIPIPRHELFKKKNYFSPQSRNLWVTTAMMHFGCPFRCSFCLDKLAYKKVWCRSPENMLDEFDYIARKGFKEVYFRDLTFGLDREKTIKFCKGLIEQKSHLRWVCASRVDILDEEILKYMKKAGCICIEFGIESGLDSTKQVYNKRITNEQIVRTFKHCRALGIETTAFLILGFPEENRDDIKKSIDFVLNLKPDFLSLNLANILPETEFQKKRLSNNNGNTVWYIYRFDTLNFPHPNISQYLLKKLLKRTLMKFYLNPLFIFKRLLKIESLGALFKLFFISLNVMRTVFFKEKK